MNELLMAGAAGRNTYAFTARRAHPICKALRLVGMHSAAQALVDRGWRGRLKWATPAKNVIPDAALDHILDVTLAGGTQISTWYIGLTDGTPTTDPSDVMNSHVGWAEVTAYSEANRQTWTPGAVSGQSVDNSGAVATITCNANSTVVGGAFLVSNNTKAGTTGTLYSVAAFGAGDKSLDSGETLDITGVFTQASA